MPTIPRVSVLIPLEHDFGCFQACCRGWLGGQSYPRSKYEVLWTVRGSSARLPSLGELLGEQDQVLPVDSDNESTHYAEAARMKTHSQEE
jgi:hypothetical protein